MAAAAASAAPAVAEPRSLEPAPVFSYFADLAAIPRPSRREERVLAWLKDFAGAKGLPWKQDAKGNLVIYKGGQGGGEGAATVILQVRMIWGCACFARGGCGAAHAHASPHAACMQRGRRRACGGYTAACLGTARIGVRDVAAAAANMILLYVKLL